MKKIGLTGGIGCGKTIICKVFKLLAVPVFDADSEAKKIYTNPIVIAEIKNTFGVTVVTENKFVDLKKISAIVFNDAEKLSQLNNIIHPKLALVFDTWCIENQHHKYIIKEAAVIIESGAHKQCDELILVISPLQMRIERVMQRNNISSEEVLKRINKQMSDDEKLPLVKNVIHNNEVEMLIPQVLKLHHKFAE